MTPEARAARVEEIRKAYEWIAEPTSRTQHSVLLLLSELDRVTAERDEFKRAGEEMNLEALEALRKRDAALARAEKAEHSRDEYKGMLDAALNAESLRAQERDDLDQQCDAAQAQVHELLCAVQAVLPEMEQSSDKEIRQLVPGLACLLPEPKP